MNFPTDIRARIAIIAAPLLVAGAVAGAALSTPSPAPQAMSAADPVPSKSPAPYVSAEHPNAIIALPVPVKSWPNKHAAFADPKRFGKKVRP